MTEVPKDLRVIPSVIGMQLDEALSKLYNSGFQNLIVCFATESTIDVTNNSVTAQSPVSYSQINPANAIRLTVYRASLGTYKADVSFKFTLEQGESNVEIGYETANYENIPYRVILYSTIRAAENTDLDEAATVYGYEPVTRTLILYVDNEPFAQQSVTFVK